MGPTWKAVNKPLKGKSAREEAVRVLRSKRKELDSEQSLREESPKKVRRLRRLSATQEHSCAGSDKQELCNRCKNIDFDAIFKSQKKIPPLNGLPILELGDLSKETRCALCRLFRAMRFPRSSSKAEKSGYHLRAFSSATVLSDTGAGNETPAVLLSVFHGRFRPKIHPWERREFPTRGFIAPEVDRLAKGVKSTSVGSCQVLPNSIDWGRIQGWLHDCQEHHGHEQTCGRHSDAMQIPLKCIDCLSGAFVEVTPNDEYLALSYVWGTAHPKPPSVKSKHLARLPESGIPQVVHDAITVVKSLGKRYLWVDKYCIDEHDARAKHYQIRNMDRIYEGAFVTIVACAGTDAASGLPGVGSVPRKWQPSALVRNHVLRSTLPPIRDALEGTTWVTRGWTYQEGALSRRCLFFTELQVYLVCSAISCCEAISSGSRPSKSFVSLSGILSANIFGNGTEILENNKPRTPLRKFADHIAQYTERNLTVETDILDAFRGLLAKSQFHSYFGIPIAPNDFTEAKTLEDLTSASQEDSSGCPPMLVVLVACLGETQVEATSQAGTGWGP